MRIPLLLSMLLLSLAAAAQTPPPGPPAPIQYQQTNESGLQYTDLAIGTGFFPQLAHKVTVKYVASFEDGRVFDKSDSYEFIYGRGYVIKGMDQGVATMKVGGHRLLRIPPDIGYGKAGFKDVPPNATLLFDVQLLAIK